MAQSEPIHTKFPQPVDDFPALARRAREEDEELSGLLIRDLQLEREDLSGLVLQDVVFDHCRLPDCDWFGTSFSDVTFHTCDLSGGNFENSYWLRLNQVNFFHTPLEHVDLTTCTIDELVLSEHCDELKGAVVDLYQAAELSRRMGLVVKL